MIKLNREAVIENEGSTINVCCSNDGKSIKYYVHENGAWKMYPERDLTRRMKAIGIRETNDIDAAILRIQRTNQVDYAGKIAGIEEGIYMIGNSDNPALNNTILNTVSSVLIEGESGECPTIMGFLMHALGHTPDQLETFLLNIKHNRNSIRKSKPWMSHFNILIGNPEVGKSLVQHQVYEQAYNGKTADCWQVIAKGKIFNKQSVESCNWICEDQALQKHTVGRESLTENIKRIASTFYESLEGKHQDAFTVELNRFGSMSANANAKAVNSLPLIEKRSTDDKISLFLFADTLHIPNMDLANNDERQIADVFSKERKAFHYLIDNYKEPIHLTEGAGRYSVNAYQHHEVMELLEENDVKSMLHSMLVSGMVYNRLFGTSYVQEHLGEEKRILNNKEVFYTGSELEELLADYCHTQYKKFEKQANTTQNWAIGYTMRALAEKLGVVDGLPVIESKRTNSGNKWIIRHTIKEDWEINISKEEADALHEEQIAEETL